MVFQLEQSQRILDAANAKRELGDKIQISKQELGKSQIFWGLDEKSTSPEILKTGQFLVGIIN